MTDKETAGVYITSAIETLYKIVNDCDEEDLAAGENVFFDVF